MERKRILDREHQRLRRQKAKRLSEMIQAEMSDLRQDLTFALERLDRLYQLVYFALQQNVNSDGG